MGGWKETAEERVLCVSGGVGRRGTADRVHAFLKRRQVTLWCAHISGSLHLGRSAAGPVCSYWQQNPEWKRGRVAQRIPPWMALRSFCYSKTIMWVEIDSKCLFWNTWLRWLPRQDRFMWCSRGISLILWALVRFSHYLLELIPEHFWEQVSLQITHRPKRVTELNPCPPTVGCF